MNNSNAKKNDLSVYAHLFHKALTKNIRVLYSEWLTRACAQSYSDFVSEVHKVFSHEIERANKYYPLIREQLVHLFGEVIVQYQGDFLSVRVTEMVNTKQEDGALISSSISTIIIVLHRLYQLLRTTNRPATLQPLLVVLVKTKVSSTLAGIPNEMYASCQLRAVMASCSCVSLCMRVCVRQNGFFLFWVHTYFVSKLLAEREQFVELIDQSHEGAPSFRDEMDEAIK
ncbi:unnamed protein product [Rodentolepis nana]|uniref:Cullin domain-containing protein n=1 Tax=Rodentolepis nana TaxID=102285 RepID=A0A0R3TAW7_RODNA|nr:unnamed protein product [Rodentolepis nana]